MGEKGEQMKFTWHIEMDSGKTIDYDLTEKEITMLDLGIIDFSDVIKNIGKKMREEDAL